MATRTLDRTALKVNQAGTLVTLLLAFLASALVPAAVVLVPLLAAVMLTGAVEPRAALFKQLYVRVLRPLGMLQPHPVSEDPRPHNFAQLLGGGCLALASVAFVLSWTLVGWAIVLLVLVLAFANLAFEF